MKRCRSKAWNEIDARSGPYVGVDVKVIVKVDDRRTHPASLFYRP